MAKSLDQLTFDNRFVRDLPADIHDVNARRQVFESCYSRVKPTHVAKPELIGWSKEVAEFLGLDVAEFETQQFADVFGGNALLDGMDPFAMCYGGHQFGNWAGQLGDGRAINLGEVLNDQDEHWTLQLKGAGPTPYSRTADGLAVLRSSIREFLCSEAMYHLGVPTTRALSLVLTGEDVRRDMFYDGNPKDEPGAVVCRVAPSFTRFGNFQLFAARQDSDTLRKLVEFTIRNDFPELLTTPDAPISNDLIATWFEEVCRRTAEMVVHWMRVGFVHGVMNTDNMSILGLTIDYGPYGWLEDYDPGWTPNTTDASGRRYRFGNQPAVAHWNTFQLANAIVQLTKETEPLEAALEKFVEHYEARASEMMASKLGLNELKGEADDAIKSELLEVLQLTETDMTLFYRGLADVPLAEDADEETLIAPLLNAYYKPDELSGTNRDRLVKWLQDYTQRARQDGADEAARRDKMNRVNPKYVLRNYMAQLAIDKSEAGDHSMIQELLEVLRHPYDEQPNNEQHSEKRPEWARDRAGCSMLSCSS
ncbi:MAG: YdiU family protein [Planctomycetaceae bacterium]